jgi:predicted nucleic-acid-binding protein
MKITADANLLLRLIVEDSPAQAVAATEALKSAELVAVSMHALCELAWVMRRQYRTTKQEVATAIRTIAGMRNVVLDRPAMEAGLRMLDAGGDFADGVMAFDGQLLGGETFFSFDKQAVSLLQEAGSEAVLLG